jgi:hypothetical protein
MGKVCMGADTQCYAPHLLADELASGLDNRGQLRTSLASGRKVSGIISSNIFSQLKSQRQVVKHKQETHSARVAASCRLLTAPHADSPCPRTSAPAEESDCCTPSPPTAMLVVSAHVGVRVRVRVRVRV